MTLLIPSIFRAPRPSDGPILPMSRRIPRASHKDSMSTCCPDQLDKALRKRLPATLCVTINGKREELPVRLMNDNEAHEEGFWVEVAQASPLIDQLIRDGTTVEVSFSLEDAKVFFDSAILRKRRHYWLKRVVLMRLPERVNVVEQRTDARTFVPDDVAIHAEVYRSSGNSSDEPLVSWRVFDLSTGGAGLICPHDQRLLDLKPDQPLRVVVRFRQLEITLFATHRYTQVLSASSVRLGVQFNEIQAKPARDGFKKLLDELTQLRNTRHIIQTLHAPRWT